MIVKWLLLGSVAAVLILAFFGNAYARQREANDLSRYSPRGQMVSILLPSGEIRIHLYCSGAVKKSAPTVILIHGGGDNSLIWSRVQPEVARNLPARMAERARSVRSACA